MPLTPAMHGIEGAQGRGDKELGGGGTRESARAPLGGGWRRESPEADSRPPPWHPRAVEGCVRQDQAVRIWGDRGQTIVTCSSSKRATFSRRCRGPGSQCVKRWPWAGWRWMGRIVTETASAHAPACCQYHSEYTPDHVDLGKGGGGDNKDELRENFDRHKETALCARPAA